MSKIIRLPTPKKMLLANTVIGLAIILCVVAVFVFVIKSGAGTTKKIIDGSASNQSATQLTTQDKRENAASDYLAKNDPNSAIKVLKAGIDSTSDKQSQALQYIRLAAMLNDYDPQGYKSQILDYAYKADGLYPTLQSATLIYDIETGYGNHVAAQRYLQIVTERTKVDSKELE